MKILITGMNKNQCVFDFYLQQQLKIITHYSLIRCFRDMGHEVDQRPVIIGESLDEYDQIIVFIHNPSGFAVYAYNALWAISRKPECILAFDDWQVDSIYSGVLALSDTEKMFRPYVKDSHKLIPDNIESYKEIFKSSIDKIESKTNKILMPTFAGGDLSLLLDYPKHLMLRYNPNPYHLHRQPSLNTLFDEPKQRVFNFAGLVQDKTKKWLKDQHIDKLSWPLKKYGSRKDGQDRVPEDQMVNIYSNQWGILMPGYFHAGSGWWRVRVCQVADAGSILIGEPKELSIFYKNQEAASIKPIDLIGMTDKQLVDFAAFQKECLYKAHPLNKEIQKEELNMCIH